MLDKIEVLCHSSIKINKWLVIYFDPFKIDKEYHDADIIFITHSHYDHYSEEDINKVRKENTQIVAPLDLLDGLLTLRFTKKSITIVKPHENYNVKGLTFKTIPAYNTNKNFHPKANNWIGYLITIDDITYYIAGDTDITEENKKVKCDVAFVFAKKLMAVLKKVYQAESVYLCTMCDGPMNHFHVQLIPRYAYKKRGSKNFVKPRKEYKEDKKKIAKIRELLNN